MANDIKITNVNKAIKNLQKVFEDHPRTAANIQLPAKELISLTQNLITHFKATISSLTSEVEGYKSIIDKHLLDKDEKLQTILDKINSNSNNTIPQYNTIAQIPPRPINKTVLVKPKNNLLTPPQAKDAICNAIPTGDIKCNQISINKSNVAYKFSCENSKNKFINLIKSNESLNLSLEAYEPTPKCPTIILKNLDYSTNESDIINNLVIQNDLQDFDHHMKLLFTIKKRFYYDAVLCVSPHIYDSLTQRTLFIGWTAVNAQNMFLLGHCSKCLSFQHRTNDCSNHLKKCKNCSLSFSNARVNNKHSEFSLHIRNCSTLKCCHCQDKNMISDHAALSENCPFYRQKIQFVWEKTCYDPTTKVQFFNKPSNIKTTNAPNNNNTTISPHYNTTGSTNTTINHTLTTTIQQLPPSPSSV
ncbi:uncharacterized protein LOC113794333 [Dermatophagoides pteronyssinus]|uniref:uncharacterized protein LOC113794333 n=1 Tax=Dermatophagoides pteronyssinus TaxID=6956 RepID=UPI003F6687AE